MTESGRSSDGVCPCRKITRLLDLYHDGELDARRRLMVEAHLRDCEHCRELLRFREQERELVRSSAPVPSLSPDFTSLVISKLTGSEGAQNVPTSSSRLFRPWFTPALAALLLLAAICWASSGHLFIGKNRVALTGRPGAYNSAASPSLRDHVVKPAPTGISPGPAAGSAAPQTAMSGEAGGSQGGQTGTGAGSASGSASNPSPAAAPNVSIPGVQAETARPPAITGATSQPTPQPGSLAALEQAGYTLFTPGYLPSGYAFQQGTPVNAQPAGPAAGEPGLILYYVNTQSGGRITLEIQPQSGPATSAGQSAAPLPPVGQAPGIQPQAPGSQQGRSFGTAPKNGNNFVLTLSGDVSYLELQRVAASVS